MDPIPTPVEPLAEARTPQPRPSKGCSATLIGIVILVIAYAAPKLFLASTGLSSQARMRDAVAAFVAGPDIKRVEISGVYMVGVQIPNEPSSISVEMIGIDSAVYGRGWSDAMRDQAIAKMQSLTEARAITIEFDSQRTQDSGNWPTPIAWIWADQELLNAEMVRLGYLFLGAFGPNTKYLDQMQLAESEAMQNENGRWASPPSP